MQDKSQLGSRYSCFECGKKFYDLNRPEPVCPGCGMNQMEDPRPDPRVAVMAAYKGSRMTAQQVTPMKDKITIEDDKTEDGVGIEESESKGEGEAEADAEEEEAPKEAPKKAPKKAAKKAPKKATKKATKAK